MVNSTKATGRTLPLGHGEGLKSQQKKTSTNRSVGYTAKHLEKEEYDLYGKCLDCFSNILAYGSLVVIPPSLCAAVTLFAGYVMTEACDEESDCYSKGELMATISGAWIASACLCTCLVSVTAIASKRHFREEEDSDLDIP